MGKFVTNLETSGRKQLRLASTVGHSYFSLPEGIKIFHARCPDVTINLISGCFPEVFQHIGRGRCNIRLALLPLKMHGVAIGEMPETNPICVMPKGHTVGDSLCEKSQ